MHEQSLGVTLRYTFASNKSSSEFCAHVHKGNEHEIIHATHFMLRLALQKKPNII